MSQSNAEQGSAPEVAVVRPKAYVGLYHSIDAARWRQQWDAGIALDETPYGFHNAEHFGFDVIFAQDAPRPAGAKLPGIVNRVFGFDVLHAWTNRRRIAEADVVWTMTEGEGFAIALLFTLGVLRPKPIICNVVWLLNTWDRTLWYKERLYRALMRHITVLSVHANGCFEVARRAFSGQRCELMHFGVNPELLAHRALRSQSPDEPLHVVSLGSDKTRDWTTLLAAFGNDSRFRLTIVCWRLQDADVAAFDNVTLLRVHDQAGLLGCYHEADIAVVPMIENIFSGITSALDAASIGVPIICSRTGGVSTYFDEHEVTYVPVGDSAALREAAAATTPEGRQAQADRAHRRFAGQDYSTRRLSRHYCEISTGLLKAVTAAPSPGS